MNWADIGKMIGPLAPTLGGIVGGMLLPGIGGAIGTEAGQLLATALGTANDPNAIGGALQNDPNAAAKIQAAESEAAAKWPAIAAIAQAQFAANAAESQTVNQTIQAELAKGQPWYHWRNLYGYSVAFEAAATSWVILYSLVIDTRLFVNVNNSLSFFLSWYALRFGLLGYIHNQATTEKVAAVTGQAPEGLIRSISKAVRGR
jgi:hypothetical protein